MTDEAPERQVVPVEDLDKIENLLNVFMSTKDMPNLSAIKQSCMDELAQVNNSLVEAQAEALAKYQKELAEWEAKKAVEAKAKAEEEKKKLAEEEAKKEKTYA
jgi:DNA-binding transcriptional regulator YbjK